MGVDPNRNTKGPSETKVCQFDNSLVVDEEVLGFQVPVEDPTTVTEINALQDLVKVALKGGEGRGKENGHGDGNMFGVSEQDKWHSHLFEDNFFKLEHTFRDFFIH